MRDYKPELDKVLVYVKENSTHWIYRCPFCGDSSNVKKGHLYVSKTSPVYRCARCGSFGHYSNILKDVHIEREDNYFKGLSSSNIHKESKFVLEDIAEGYLLERFGENFIVDPKVAKIISTKTMFNLVPKEKYSHIPTECVSFLTHLNRKIVCRNIGKDVDKFGRYTTFSISEGPDVYILDNPRKMDLFRRHKTIVVGEGIFDILHAYSLKFFPEDSVYTAALNSNILNAVRISKQISNIFEANLIILADADMPDSHYLNPIRKEKFLSIQIYRNKLGKDFGELSVVPERSL